MGEFYAASLPRTTSRVVARYPEEVPEWQAEFAGRPLTVDVSIDGFLLTLINAGPAFAPNPSVSFLLRFDPSRYGGDAAAARAELDDTWTKLAEGGSILMPLDEYPFNPHYGWVQDRFGVSWQLMLADAASDTEPAPFVTPQLMFSGRVQNQAREAAEYYSSLFDDAGVGFVAQYPEQTGPAAAGSVMFGEFRLAGQQLSMMDSGVEQDTPFTVGISLEVRCADQGEIDRLWDALSAVPEAEQCGWLADRWGLSWQIVPENMGELMAHPGAYDRMLQMKKLVIAEL